MKYKLLGGAMVVLILVCALAASVLEAEEGPARIHQHLSARGPDAGCGCDGAELCTHLPLVIIDTGGQEIPGAPMGYDADGETIYSTTADGESMLSARISILDNETRNHHPSDTPDLESAGLIRIRGRSSRYFDKHNYLLRFTDDDGAYADHEVMGMDAHYEWTLHGPYLDKSLIRNYLWYNIAGEMMEYSPNVRFCEVILNGAYQGLYLMTETITNGENSRVNVSEPIDNSTSTGYVLRLDQGSRTDLKNINNFTYYTYRISRRNHLNINIEYPRSGALTQEMADAIEQDLSDFEKALYSFDYDDRIYGYQNWVDVKSFADYFIFNEFTELRRRVSVHLPLQGHRREIPHGGVGFQQRLRQLHRPPRLGAGLPDAGHPLAVDADQGRGILPADHRPLPDVAGELPQRGLPDELY